MPIDYPQLVAGLGAAGAMVDDGAPLLASLGQLISTARVSVGASGATYTEYGSVGGRVVIATGSMAWACGQPVEPEYIDRQQTIEPVLVSVEQLPARLSEPLLGRGLAAIGGSAIRTGGVVRGAVHLYFDEVDPQPWADIRDVIRLVASSARNAYPIAGEEPDAAARLKEQEDRALFLAVAGHELRTPVTVLKGYAGMLADRWSSLDESDRLEAARVLSQRADELARLVDRLLVASVGDGASGSLVRAVAFDPIEALSRAVAELPAELAGDVQLELPTSLPRAFGDPAALAAVMGELVTNALRYSTPPKVLASSANGRAISPAKVELIAGADAQTVVLRVCDRGVGIEPAQVEQAFERFWRARRDGDPRGGVGLGLYLVRRLVERQNGWVSLRPRDGGGTIAEVRLPRADGPLRGEPPGEA